MTDDHARDMAKWLRFMGMQEAKEVIEDAVSAEDDEKQRNLRIAYEMTDGETSSHEIADYVTVSQWTVSSWQRKWFRRGIANRSAENDPYEHLISLEDLGIDVPNSKEVNNTDENSGEGENADG